MVLIEALSTSMSFRSSKNGENVLPFPGRRALAAMPSAEPLLPVLIILHQETSTPGRVGNALRALGHPLGIRRPRFGGPLPNAGFARRRGDLWRPDERNDPGDYVHREIDWIEIPLREQRPFLGICLGAQMPPVNWGASAPHPEGQTPIGYYPIRPTDAGTRFELARPGLPLAPRGFCCQRTPNCSRKATTFRCRRSSRTRSASSSP